MLVLSAKSVAAAPVVMLVNTYLRFWSSWTHASASSSFDAACLKCASVTCCDVASAPEHPWVEWVLKIRVCCELVFSFFICGVVAIICWGLEFEFACWCQSCYIIICWRCHCCVGACCFLFRTPLCSGNPPVPWDQVLCLLFTAVAWRCPWLGRAPLP